MKFVITMTDLSTLTKKTRPTINKYLNSYNEKNFDEVPYSFIKLFDLLNDPKTTQKHVIKYCEETFMNTTDDILLNEIIQLLKDNKEKIDLKLLKETLVEELNDDNK